MNDVRVGITPPWDLGHIAAEDQRRRLATVADAGIDHVFTADHVSFVGGAGIDGPVRLAAIGGMEPRLGLYLGVFLLSLRHPLVAARQIASLAEMAPGRVTIGVGVGGEDRHEFEVCEIDPATRGRRTDAALDIVRRLLDGETVNGDGVFYEFTEAQIRPTPAPRIAFTVGGRSDAAIRRAAGLGDGWLASWCSVGRFMSGVAMTEDLGADRVVDWQHGLQIWAGIGADRAEARGYVADGMQTFYGIPFEAFEKYTPMGTADDITEFLLPYVEAGAKVINVSPCGPSREAEAEVMGAVADRLRRG